VHIALHEVGAPFQGRTIDFGHRQNDPPELQALNPEGKVPTRVIDGRPLTEVAAILYYLARTYPAAGLFPFGDIDAATFPGLVAHHDRMMARPAVQAAFEAEAALGSTVQR
jgi:glutathione S-transferase